jgi:hypothetical protein
MIIIRGPQLPEIPRSYEAGQADPGHVCRRMSGRDLTPMCVTCGFARTASPWKQISPVREIPPPRVQVVLGWGISGICVRGPIAPNNQYARPVLTCEFALDAVGGAR